MYTYRYQTIKHSILCHSIHTCILYTLLILCLLLLFQIYLLSTHFFSLRSSCWTLSSQCVAVPNLWWLPDNPLSGKKLQCPYCERLYGYETNLRAHIRQRHQGIRAPCPYCSRTFTRNNTVRRHIAREHKTELNLTAKAFQLSQVQNHNQ